MSIEFQPIEDRHHDALRVFLAKNNQDFDDNDLTTSAYLHAYNIPNRILAGKKDIGLVAVDRSSDRILGIAVMQYMVFGDRRSGGLWYGVDRDMRGIGIGKQLVARLLDMASKSGVTYQQYMIHALKDNIPSIRMAEHFGFQRGRHLDYSKRGRVLEGYGRPPVIGLRKILDATISDDFLASSEHHPSVARRPSA